MPFPRRSGGVDSRDDFGLARLSLARITAQSGGPLPPAAEVFSSALAGAPGTSGLGGWQGSFATYSESARHTRPAMGKPVAGSSSDHVWPGETPPGGAPAPS